MQSSPASRYLLPLRSKYSPQHPVLRHLNHKVLASVNISLEFDRLPDKEYLEFSIVSYSSNSQLQWMMVDVRVNLAVQSYEQPPWFVK
jgi:hypothetical protein